MTGTHDHRILTAVTAARHDPDFIGVIDSVASDLTTQEAVAELLCAVAGLIGMVNTLASQVPNAEEAIDEMNRKSALKQHMGHNR